MTPEEEEDHLNKQLNDAFLEVNEKLQAVGKPMLRPDEFMATLEKSMEVLEEIEWSKRRMIEAIQRSMLEGGDIERGKQMLALVRQGKSGEAAKIMKRQAAKLEKQNAELRKQLKAITERRHDSCC